jgi:hypothetical protein
VLIDGEHGRLPQGAAQRDVAGTSMPHDQDRLRIMAPVEEYPSAVEKRLARDAQDLGLAFQGRLKLIGIWSSVFIPVRGYDQVEHVKNTLPLALIAA